MGLLFAGAQSHSCVVCFSKSKRQMDSSFGFVAFFVKKVTQESSGANLKCVAGFGFKLSENSNSTDSLFS